MWYSYLCYVSSINDLFLPLLCVPNQTIIPTLAMCPQSMSYFNLVLCLGNGISNFCILCLDNAMSNPVDMRSGNNLSNSV